MDFPLEYNKDATFVTSVPEVKQNIVILIKNMVHSFYQSYTLGTYIPQHSADRELIEYGIRQTVSEIANLQVNNITFTMEGGTLQVVIEVEYLNKTITVKTTV